MPLTVRQVVEQLAALGAAPDVLHAGDLDASVRWVHSSEIYEIGPLLAGGELLLTTGLGVATVDAGARRHYVRDLAGRGVAALCLEVGRSLPDVPQEMALEAARHRMPLVALRQVVPFITIAESVNRQLAAAGVARLERLDAVGRALTLALTEERGLSGLLAVTSEHVGGPVVLLSAAGPLVAAAGVPDDREAWSVVDDPASQRAAVVVRGRPWGTVAAAPGATGAADHHQELHQEVLTRVAQALAVEIGRGARPVGRRDQVGARVLGELVAAAPPADTDVLVQAGSAGFHPRSDDLVVPVAISAPETRAGLAVVEGAARTLGGLALRGVVGDQVLALFAVSAARSAAAPDVVAAVTEALARAWERTGRPPVRMAVGQACDSGRQEVAQTPPRAWRRSLLLAQRTLATAGSVPVAVPTPGAPVTTARSRLLDLAVAADPELMASAIDVVAPLTRWDARHGSDLVRTVEVHLLLGSSPQRTAEQLRIGRQAVHQRLRRAEQLLGADLQQPEMHACLLLAGAALRCGVSPAGVADAGAPARQTASSAASRS